MAVNDDFGLISQRIPRFRVAGNFVEPDLLMPQYYSPTVKYGSPRRLVKKKKTLKKRKTGSPGKLPTRSPIRNKSPKKKKDNYDLQ